MPDTVDLPDARGRDEIFIYIITVHVLQENNKLRHGCKGKRIRFQRLMLQPGVLCKGTHVPKWQITHEKIYIFSCTQTAPHMQTNLYLSFVTNDLSCTLLRSSMQGPRIILRGHTVPQCMPSHIYVTSSPQGMLGQSGCFAAMDNWDNIPEHVFLST